MTALVLPDLREVKDRSPRWAKTTADVATRTFALATASLRPVPDFLVIGVKRGGTTSLFNYLLHHPGVLGLYPQVRGKKSTDFFFREQHRGERWYRSHFHTHLYRGALRWRLGQAPLGGEASPYYLWDPRVAARVRAVAPGLKAIVLLRDPVARAWSHYQERVQNGVEPLSFEEALRAEEDRTAGELERMLADPRYYSAAHDWYSYRARGVYLPQLRNWVASFPEDQLLVLRSEDLYGDPQRVFDAVCRFLGLPHVEMATTRPYNASRAHASIPTGPREELASYYAPHNAALEEHLGRKLWT